MFTTSQNVYPVFVQEGVFFAVFNTSANVLVVVVKALAVPLVENLVLYIVL